MPLSDIAEAVVAVHCGACGHPATVAAPSDAWKCNCAAGISNDPDCTCDALNQSEGVESNPPDTVSGEIAALNARLATLRGGAHDG